MEKILNSPTASSRLTSTWSSGISAIPAMDGHVARRSPPCSRKPVRAQFGATHSLSGRKGEFWITAVGDAPAATLQSLFDALQRRP